jgi:CubicO group peptidase (beta-lactamase class C family)
VRARISGTAFLGAAIVGCSGWMVYYSGGAVARAADEVMRDEVARGDFSGTVLVSRDGQSIFEKSYGLADAERRIPNTSATKFQIGSITKSLTAVLVLQLEQERRLSLSDAICNYLEECPSGWAPIQLHHLLAHTSGIYNFTNDRAPEALLPTPQTHEQILARFLHAPLEFRAGEKFSYSNPISIYSDW